MKPVNCTFSNCCSCSDTLWSHFWTQPYTWALSCLWLASVAGIDREREKVWHPFWLREPGQILLPGLPVTDVNGIIGIWTLNFLAIRRTLFCCTTLLFSSHNLRYIHTVLWPYGSILQSTHVVSCFQQNWCQLMSTEVFNDTFLTFSFTLHSYLFFRLTSCYFANSCWSKTWATHTNCIWELRI